MKNSIAKRTVIIPLSAESTATTELELIWKCPKCELKRGEPIIGRVFRGQTPVKVHQWYNPCGHIDDYANVLKEAVNIFVKKQTA